MLSVEQSNIKMKRCKDESIIIRGLCQVYGLVKFFEVNITREGRRSWTDVFATGVPLTYFLPTYPPTPCFTLRQAKISPYMFDYPKKTYMGA